MNSVSINFTLKPLSKTRWESRIDALKLLRYQLGDIYDALINISDWSSLVQRHSHRVRERWEVGDIRPPLR